MEILYRYECYKCNTEYISEDSKLKYCNSNKCIDQDVKLYGPYLCEEVEECNQG